MAEPILNITTLVERATVVINGRSYELIGPGEISLIDYHRIGSKSARVDALSAKGADLSDSEVAEMSTALAELTRVVLLAPDDVHASLKDLHRLSIMQAFSQLRGNTKAAPAETPIAPPTSTGGSSSPASSGSTGAPRSSGSRRSRSRSS